MSRPPINVLHIVETLGTGGMENGVVNLVNGLDPSVASAEVLCTRGLGALAGRISPDKLHYDEAVGHGITGGIRAVRELCRAGKFDVVHSHSWATLMPGYFGTRLSNAAKFVHGEHGTLYLDRPRRRIIQRMIFNRADRCLAVSNSLVTEIAAKLRLPTSKFSVIANGVDVEKFRPDSKSRDALLHSIDANSDAIIIGSVGRLVAVKDYPTLIRAFGMLRNSTGNACHLVLVGDGPERERLHELARAENILDQVHFWGECDTVNKILPAFDIFVLPSLREGMSNTLLEAAACGVVTVASDIPPNREVVVEGSTGLFFEVGNPDSLFERLQQLVSSDTLRKNMYTKSLALARHKLSIENMIQNYEQLYCSLFDSPASGHA